MRVLAVIHGLDVRPEVFADVLAEDGHELVEWDIPSQGAPPDGFGAVLVFGGDQNVGEESRYPWLRDEYAALLRWVEQETPLLGVCLGAQTLAHALGAPVRRVPPGLAGFYDTELTADGERDPVLGVLPQRFRAFNGNAYSFQVPAGGVLLATGPAPQAFRAGAVAWGVQFHPEIRRDQALTWWTDETLPRPRAELERELDTELPGWQELGRRLCRAFLAAAEG
jgi:GMP synthase-like glutamine amidotransferase